MIPEAESELARTKSSVRKAFESVYDLLVSELGCSVAVRTGYISFTIGSQMVVAAHPAEASVDLALALPLDESDPKLFDATDYKWRNLPSGTTITTAASAKVAARYVREAVRRVESGETLEVSGEKYARPKGSYRPAFKKFKD